MFDYRSVYIYIPRYHEGYTVDKWDKLPSLLVFFWITEIYSGQISIIPKPELRGFWGSSLIKPPFRVTSADVVIICPEPCKLWDFNYQPQLVM